MKRFLFRLIFVVTLSSISVILIYNWLKPIFYSDSIIIPFSPKQLDIATKYPETWNFIKISFLVSHFLSSTIIINSLFNVLFKNINFQKNKNITNLNKTDFSLFIGNNEENNIYIPEKGLYQNIFITGTIGTGKTSSAMYPFTKQLMEHNSNNSSLKIGMLILDVKGNFHKEVRNFAKSCSREDDLIVIELGKNIKYNPLDKPNLKPIVLANRLKTILTLFSTNNTDSYWLDKAEQVLCECIKLCRLYNNGYVTFEEIHKLINIPDYYKSKILILKNKFQSGLFSLSDTYNLNTSLEFFEKEFICLDPRVLSILKSEITRITGLFISDHEVFKTFCPKKEEINFYGFKDVVENGKIVVLNMNIAEYKNLSKIIATYLKLDFQTEVISRLSTFIQTNSRPVAFICDEFHEYVTSTDADFFAQSREAKCINIVATQSYTSILNTLKDEHCTKSIIQNLINKLWFRTDDIYTIEEIQKQIGKEDKQKVSKTISENAKETTFDFFTNNLKSKNSSISESINTYTQNDYIYDTHFFTCELQTFSCLAFLSTGSSIIPPTHLNLTPIFKNTKERIVIFNE